MQQQVCVRMDDCDMGPPGDCMFKRALPAIPLASTDVHTDIHCSAEDWRPAFVGNGRGWLARELAEAGPVCRPPQPHAPWPRRHSSLIHHSLIARARVRAGVTFGTLETWNALNEHVDCAA